jgi:hypothetical protein
VGERSAEEWFRDLQEVAEEADSFFPLEMRESVTIQLRSGHVTSGLRAKLFREANLAV